MEAELALALALAADWETAKSIVATEATDEGVGGELIVRVERDVGTEEIVRVERTMVEVSSEVEVEVGVVVEDAEVDFEVEEFEEMGDEEWLVLALV